MAAPQPNTPRDPADAAPAAAAGLPRALRPPTLGDFLRTARQERQLSRDQLAISAAVSSSYIAQLETGEKVHPTVAALRALATALQLSPVDLRHLYDLARLPLNDRDDRELGDIKNLANEVTPEMRAFLDSLNPTQAAYFDSRWNVLSANDSYARGFPGMIESGNVLRWLFTAPAAKTVLVEWEKEAALTVHWFRALMGTHKNDERSARILDELSADPDFARMWLDEDINFSRQSPYMRVRDPDTGELNTLNAQLHSLQTPAGETLLLYLASRLRHTGRSTSGDD